MKSGRNGHPPLAVLVLLVVLALFGLLLAHVVTSGHDCKAGAAKSLAALGAVATVSAMLSHPGSTFGLRRPSGRPPTLRSLTVLQLR